jgi:hypothetical protein
MHLHDLALASCTLVFRSVRLLYEDRKEGLSTLHRGGNQGSQTLQERGDSEMEGSRIYLGGESGAAGRLVVSGRGVGIERCIAEEQAKRTAEGGAQHVTFWMQSVKS